MQVNLPVHQTTRIQHLLHGVDALAYHGNVRTCLPRHRVHAHAVQDALYANAAFNDTREVRIAPEIVHPVHVQLARNKLVEKRSLVFVVEHLKRQVYRWTQLRSQRLYQSTADVFMGRFKDEPFFAGMRKRRMADVVQQHCSKGRGMLFVRNRRTVSSQDF